MQLGRSTNVVSLPRKWVLRYGLKAGDEVEVAEQGKQLLLSTEKDKAVEKAKLNISALYPIHNYAMLAMYIKGAEELEITSEKAELISRLPTHPMNQLSGYEIIEQTKNRALVKDVSGNKEIDLQTLFRRVWLLIISMSEETISSLKKKEKDFSHIVAMDLNVNRLAHLILRLINKRGIINAPVLYYMAAQLELIGDTYKRLAKHVQNQENEIKFLEKVNKQLRQSYELFFNFEPSKAAQIDKAYRLLEQEFDKAKFTRTLFFAEYISKKIIDIVRNLLIVSI